MYDCVFPTRTAVSSIRTCLKELQPNSPSLLPLQRFGFALVPTGKIDLRKKEFAADFRPIDAECLCLTCRQHTRAYLQPLILQKETVACNLITVHNLTYQVRGRGLHPCGHTIGLSLHSLVPSFFGKAWERVTHIHLYVRTHTTHIRTHARTHICTYVHTHTTHIRPYTHAHTCT